MAAAAAAAAGAGVIEEIQAASVSRICSAQVVVDLPGAVKELVENSLDAGATRVDVRLRDFGAEAVEVSDNGSGIVKEDFEGLTARHATSKLAAFEDLARVRSFGFRGEALSALCELAGAFSVTTRASRNKCRERQRQQRQDSATTQRVRKRKRTRDGASSSAARDEEEEEEEEEEGDDNDIGTKLVFDRSGRIVQQQPIARSVGTTVLVERLFEALPVRRSEFLRSVRKKQFSRLVKVLQGYALISVGVRFSCMNTTTTNNSGSGGGGGGGNRAKSGGSKRASSATGAASRRTILTTQASPNLAGNVANVFGAKFLGTLAPFECEISTAPERESSPSPSPASARPSSEGEGGSPDMEPETKEQRRDDDLRGHDGDHPPVPAASTRTESNTAESAETAAVVRVTGFVSKAGIGVGRSDNDRQFLFVNGRPVDLPKVVRVLNDSWRQFEMKHKPACILNFDLPAGSFDVNVTPDKREVIMVHEARILEELRTRLCALYEPSRSTFQLHQGVKANQTQQSLGARFLSAASSVSTVTSGMRSEGSAAVTASPAAPAHKEDAEEREEEEQDMEEGEEDLTQPQEVGAGFTAPTARYIARSGGDEKEDVEAVLPRAPSAEQDPRPSAVCEEPEAQEEEDEEAHELDDDDDDVEEVDSSSQREAEPTRVAARLSVDVGDLMNRMSRKRRKLGHAGVEGNTSAPQGVRADGAKAEAAELCAVHETDAARAEEGLSRVLSKQDFLDMQILGQFNKGFIIVRIRDDLFILDQHACDEKFRFETLQETTKIHEQPLVHPLPVECSAAEEIVIVENLGVFERNGFRFEYDEDAPPMQRLKLTALPFSKNVEFSLEDVHELASLLSETPYLAERVPVPQQLTQHQQEEGQASPARPAQTPTQKMIRLPKARAMFASRACRSAVMIGDSLNQQQMNTIVRHLHELEQPWNCPHGRPTMRHLFTLPQSPAPQPPPGGATGPEEEAEKGRPG